MPREGLHRKQRFWALVYLASGAQRASPSACVAGLCNGVARSDSEQEHVEQAAVVVSVVGAAIALLSWFESWKSRRAAETSAAAARESAEAAKVSAQIEADRRHDELAPVLRTEWTEVGNRVGTWASGVRVYNERAIDYTEVQAELLPAPAGTKRAVEQIESVETHYVGPASSPIPLGELPSAGDTSIVVHPVFDEGGLPRGGPFRLQLQLTAPGGASWTCHVDEEVPPPPRIY